MAFFEEFTESIANGSQVVAGKAKEISKVTALNLQLAKARQNLSASYKEIGKYVVENYKDQLAEQCGDKFENVQKSLEEIDELTAQITALKGLKVCECCKQAVPKDSAFCPKCGAKMPEEVVEEPVEVEEEVVVENDAEVEEPNE